MWESCAGRMKWPLKGTGWRLIKVAQNTADSCEYGNELSGYKNGGELYDHLSNFYVYRHKFCSMEVFVVTSPEGGSRIVAQNAACEQNSCYRN